MPLLIHLIPRLPPAVCGVGDYAALVGQRMETLCPDLQCHYLACGHPAQPDFHTSPDYSNLTGVCAPTELWLALDAIVKRRGVAPAGVILHYSGYGYHQSGAPKWLAEAVEQRPTGIRLVTFFHELYARSRPWRRAFWHTRSQRRIAARVALASDELITNREQSARWLEEVSGRSAGSLRHLPICSNIGEPLSIVPWSIRSPHAVLFGNSHFKRPFFQGQPSVQVLKLLSTLGITKLIDIGVPLDSADHAFRGSMLEVEHTGILPAAEVETLISSAKVAFFDYYPGYFAKSGVLAAFAACETPVVTLQQVSDEDGLTMDRELLALATTSQCSINELTTRLADASGAIHQWYQPHSVSGHASALLDSAIINWQPCPSV